MIRGLLLLLHYGVPLALGGSLALVIQRSTQTPFSAPGIAFLLAGIGAAYSVDRLLDPSSTRLPLPRWVFGILLATASVSVAILLFLARRLPTSTLVVAAILAAICLVYPRLKRLPLVKTAAVAISWTWACVVFPLDGPEHLAWSWWSLDISPALLLLLASGCILCDLKDAAHDKANRIKTLPVLLGPRGACYIATLLALIAMALTRGSYPGLTITGVTLALVAQFPSFLSREAIGPLVIDFIYTLPGILILAKII